MLGFLLLFALAPELALAKTQTLFDTSNDKLIAVGWNGFLDTRFMIESIGALLLATVLGAVIGFHPTTPRTVDSLEEADMPKVYIMYAFVGAVIGVTVREFGMVIGVVVFGIGGLIRFRTDAGNTRDTGRLISVTLSGLIAGLGLPHFAIITTVFVFVMIYLFDSRPACLVKIDHLPPGKVDECAAAYRAALEKEKCKIISERRVHAKNKVEFLFRLPSADTKEGLNATLAKLPPDLCGEIDWEID
jgi:hypothetical protein